MCDMPHCDRPEMALQAAFSPYVCFIMHEMTVAPVANLHTG